MHSGHFFLFFGRTSLASLHPKHSERLLLRWTVVLWNCHPCCGDGWMVSSSGLFSQLGLCMDCSKGVSLSQGNSSTWCWVWLSCSPPPLLRNSPATVLAPPPSCAPLMDRLGCLTSCHTPKCRAELVFRRSPPTRTVSLWSYQNCPSEALGSAIHQCLELSGVRFQKS